MMKYQSDLNRSLQVTRREDIWLSGGVDSHVFHIEIILKQSASHSGRSTLGKRARSSIWMEDDENMKICDPIKAREVYGHLD
jgi:hypothetical protein